MNHTHFVKTVTDNRRQSLPKVAYRLAWYIRTTAAPSFCIFNMARHGDVEFNEIKKVGGIPYGPDVLIKPKRDLGRAVV